MCLGRIQEPEEKVGSGVRDQREWVLSLGGSAL